MKTTKWKVRNMILRFPLSWSKSKVVNFCNQDFKICPFCGKIDCSFEHLNECTSSHQEKELTNEQFYK